VKEKIKELALTGLKGTEIFKKIIRTDLQIQNSSRRFNPTSNDIRNHVNKALRKTRLAQHE